MWHALLHNMLRCQQCFIITWFLHDSSFDILQVAFVRFFHQLFRGKTSYNFADFLLHLWWRSRQKYVEIRYSCAYFYHYELHLRKKMFCINGMVLQQGKRWASSRLSSQWSENFRRHPLWQFTKSVLYNFDILCVAEPSEITEHLMTVLPCRRRERCNYDS